MTPDTPATGDGLVETGIACEINGFLPEKAGRRGATNTLDSPDHIATGAQHG